jgi:hypothetical protein
MRTPIKTQNSHSNTNSVSHIRSIIKLMLYYIFVLIFFTPPLMIFLLNFDWDGPDRG